MKPIVVNCEKVSFDSTLGVANVLIQVCKALAHENRLIFVVPDVDSFLASPAHAVISGIADDIISIREGQTRTSIRGRSAIELLPHHFQPPCHSDISISICHDMHVFDVGWKYKDPEAIERLFRDSLRAATVVMTHFPRTYYQVEAVADITLMNLFLTESPLLLDTSSLVATDRNHAKQGPDAASRLLYPAQLQAHKNHEALIWAVWVMKNEGRPVQIICPGSDFSEAQTNSLKKLTEELGVASEIEFPGRVSDDRLLEYYKTCDAVIVPSLAEGGAYVPFEAIAAGLPVAVNGIKAARLHLESIDGKVVWFDSMDLSSTLGAIKELLDCDRDFWRSQNELARGRITEMTWEGVARKWQAVIDWLAGKRERPFLPIDRKGASFPMAV